MITKEFVLSILNDINADNRVWVAGSAAICPTLAGDVDIWISAKSKVKPELFDVNVWPEFSVPEYGSLPVSKRIQGSHEGNKIQFMFLNEGASIWDLLSGFDMSCHAWARNRAGFFIGAPGATFPGQPITILNNDELVISNERKAKFKARYVGAPPTLPLWHPGNEMKPSLIPVSTTDISW